MGTQSISILGCGWLGFPLARRLVQLEFAVKGSSTTQSKLPLLEKSSIEPFLITAAPQVTGEEIKQFFQSKILFLNIPFRRDLKNPVYYKQQIDSVIARVEASPVEFVIFAGSTSVYPEAVKEASEDVSIVSDNSRAEVLRGIERALLDNPGFQATVVRFAGLYGGDRQIGRMLAGKKGLGEARAPVNLIHLEDCVEIVTRIIQKDIRGEIINACSDGHPTRQKLYTKAALHYGRKPPQFSDQPQSRFKVVGNTKLKEKLGYTFKHPDPLDF